MLAIRHASLTDAGLLHQSNDDRWHADPVRGVYFVTDGMANQVAPQCIVDNLPGLLQDEFLWPADPADPQTATSLQRVLADLNERIYIKCRDLNSDGAIGATLVLALVHAGAALLAHLGDSRIYLHRAGRLEQLTREHSVVQNMLDSGILTPAAVLALRSNGGPTRFVGMPGTAQAEVRLLRLQVGDRLLLCSDGLTEMLFDEDILSILNKSEALPDACRHLVDAAKVAGGFDNITVLLVGAT
jgi:PPM family protein phosphatase